VNWLLFVVELLGRLPIEKILVRPPDHTKALQELKDVLEGASASKQGDTKKVALIERLNREANEAKVYLKGRE